MFVAFGIGVTSVLLMVLLAFGMLALKTMRGGRRLLRPVGVALIAGGVVLVTTAVLQ